MKIYELKIYYENIFILRYTSYINTVQQRMTMSINNRECVNGVDASTDIHPRHKYPNISIYSFISQRTNDCTSHIKYIT